MIRMRYLYYCNSAYQILTVLNLHWHRKYAGFEDIPDYEADLIVLNSFSQASEIAEVVRNTGLFESVILVEKVFNSGRLHALNMLIDLLWPSRYLRNKYGFRSSEIKNRYAAITVPKYSTITSAIWRLNPEARLHILEDGVGTYFGSIRLKPDSRLYRRFYRQLNHGRDFFDYERIYLNDVSLYSGHDSDRVKEIPQYDEGFLKQISTAFADFADISDLKGRNIYYFAQFLNNRDINIFIDSLLEMLEEYEKQIVYVPHPRHKDEKTYPFAYAKDKQIWEIRQPMIDDLDRKLLISIHSTACFTPKILFGREPYILLFYDLCDDEVTTRNEAFDRFVSLFRKTYHDPDRIMIPSSVEEFRDCLNSYLDKENIEI